MSLDLRMKLTDEQADKFNEIAAASIGNKTHVKNELIDFAINKFHKKLFKPADILAKLNKEVGE